MTGRKQRSPHIPLVSEKELETLAREREAFAGTWLAQAAFNLQAVREASVAMLSAMLGRVEQEAQDETPVPQIPSEVVDRYAGYRGQERRRWS